MSGRNILLKIFRTSHKKIQVCLAAECCHTFADMDDYEYIPYESLSFADTHPDRLAVLGHVFGLRSPPIDTCRVLEVGCAEGGNLIPMAWSLPNAQFVGIDLSVVQTERGAEKIAELGLSNVVIHHGNILDLNGELEKFDYIIAHGVLSWVDISVREKLMASIRKLRSVNVWHT